MEIIYFEIFDNIIEAYKDNPIDLLNIGDTGGEIDYLRLQRPDYIRTLHDICGLFPDEAVTKTKILEIGSFLGALSIALSHLGFLVTAYDIPEFNNNEHLRQLFYENKVDCIAGNLRDFKLPFDDEYFDAVVFCETLEHLNFNPLPVLYEINRITKPQGFIYLSMPNQASIRNRLKILSGRSIHPPISQFFQQLDSSQNMIVGIHWREYTLAETVELLEGMGYKIILKSYWHSTDVYMDLNIKNLIQRLVYQVPSLKPYLVTIGRKQKRPEYHFWFTEANR
jgi:SAM-dependent methyltransferase